MLLELERVKPGIIEVEKMAHIPLSEYQFLKNELNNLKTIQSKPAPVYVPAAPPSRLWATEANLAQIEKVMELKSEGSVAIALDGYLTSKKLAEKYLELKRQRQPAEATAPEPQG